LGRYCGHWADIGQTLGRHWADIGQTLGRHWADIGQTLGRHFLSDLNLTRETGTKKAEEFQKTLILELYIKLIKIKDINL
jgi:hypothetical protein